MPAYFMDKKTSYKGKAIVRFTSDKLGETISLSNDETMMIVVPFEPVAELIEEVRKGKSK